jgi:hypothetical protein
MVEQFHPRRIVMGKIDVCYDALASVDRTYTDRLQDKECFVRHALSEIGRACSVRWVPIDDGQGHLLFRLTADSGDCIAQVTPLDLTLRAREFERIIALGKRPCTV